MLIGSLLRALWLDGRPCCILNPGTQVAAPGFSQAFRLPPRSQTSLLVASIVCLFATWYFALVVAPSALGVKGPAIVPDLYPAWYATRQVLFHHANPYSPAVTEQIQIEMLGRRFEAGGQNPNQQRFAYPLYASLLFVPLALLPFSWAQTVAFAAWLLLTIFSVLWWLPDGVSNFRKTLLITLTLASYPVVLGLQLRQPTMLIAALLAAVVFCLRSGRLVLAGCLAALSTAKPQLAIAVLLPLLFWAVAEWRSRKSFLLSLACSEFCLLAAAELMFPRWLPAWLQTVQAYANYAGARPRLLFLLPRNAASLAAALLVVVVIWASWKWRNSDPLFAIGFSAAAFQLIFPFQMYNEVLLLPAVLWVVLNHEQYGKRGQVFGLLFACLWIVLGAGWLAAVGLSVVDLVHSGSAAKLAALPLSSVWLLPFVVFTVLATCAVVRLSLPVSSDRPIPC